MSEREAPHPHTTAELHDKDLQSDSHHHHVQRAILPIRINADNESKGAILLYVLTMVLPLTLGLIIVATALPNSTQYLSRSKQLINTNLASCTSYLQMPANGSTQLTCFNGFQSNSSNSMGIFIREVSKLNQFMLMHLNLHPYATNNNAAPVFNQDINFKILVATVDPTSQAILVAEQISSSVVSIHQSIDNLSKRTFILGVEAKLSEGDMFYWQVTFPSTSVITNQAQFHLETEVVRSSFTIYTIVLRAVFFILALMVCIRYTSLILMLPKKRVSVEQRFVHILSILTLLFNDQLYFITVLWPNPVTSFINAFFVWNFFFFLFYLWASFLLRIYHQQIDTENIQPKRPHIVIPFVVFYLTGLIFTIAFSLIQLDQHPIVTPQDIEKPYFKFFLGFIITCFILATLFIIYLFLIVCNKQIVAYRHSAFMYLSIILLFAVIAALAMGSLDLFVYSSSIVMYIFAVTNFYSYLLQYLYSPTKEQLAQFQGRLWWEEGKQRFRNHDDEIDTVDIDLTYGVHEDQSENENRSEHENSLGRGSLRKQIRSKHKRQRRKSKDMISDDSHNVNIVQVADTRSKLLKHQSEPPKEQKQKVYSQFDVEDDEQTI